MSLTTGSDPLELSQLHRVELDKSQPLYSSYGPDCSTSLYNSKGHLLPRLDKVRKASGKKHKFSSSLHGSPSRHRTMSWLKIARASAAAHELAKSSAASLASRVGSLRLPLSRRCISSSPQIPMPSYLRPPLVPAAPRARPPRGPPTSLSHAQALELQLYRVHELELTGRKKRDRYACTTIAEFASSALSLVPYITHCLFRN
jgi:hypothetical protein